MNLLQENCFLQFHQIFHDKLSTTAMKDFEHSNQLLQTSLRTALINHKGAFPTMPSKNDLLKVYQHLLSNKKIQPDNIIETLLTTRVVRSSSGVLPISIALDGRAPVSPHDNDGQAPAGSSSDMEEGFSCAYNCSFCPNECVANGAEKDIARSYLSSEGTFIRGAIQNFNTVEQVWRRLAELEVMGHVPDKLEIIPLGGTWDCYPRTYREKFSRDLFYACNTYSLLSMKYNGEYAGLLKNWISSKPFQHNLPLDPAMCHLIYTTRPIRTLEDEKYINTKSNCCRIIGLVFETRPDRINKPTLLEKRRLGCTRIQLGIQHTDEDVLYQNNRGHDVRTTRKAIRYARDAGFKVDGHIMPDLPFTTIEKDYEMVREVFLGTDLQLDYCKVYPCLDLPYTLARKWKEEGAWKPYAENNFPEFLKLLCYTLSIVPPWVRINRVQRDFPEASEKNHGLGFVSDTIKTNLHQIVDQEMAKNNQKCFDIRSREIKNTILTKEQLDQAQLYIRSYRANEGTEFFISVEIPNSNRFDDAQLLGLARLRFPDSEFTKYETDILPPHILPTFRNKSLRIARIRELHVYGNIATKTIHGNSQHRGIGKFLVGVAESICRMYDFDMVTIISGVGVRDYYEKLGYQLGEKEDEYMIKYLNESIPLQTDLFNKHYDLSRVYNSLSNSKITKKYIHTEMNKPFAYPVSATNVRTHTYTDVQNGEPEGFAFSVSDRLKYLENYLDFICIALIIIGFMYSLHILM